MYEFLEGVARVFCFSRKVMLMGVTLGEVHVRRPELLRTHGECEKR